MKIEKTHGATIRRLTASMVTDVVVLGKVVGAYERGCLGSSWADLVASWCVDYYNQYNSAPGAAIEDIFNGWKVENNDDENTKLVESFLQSISDEYEQEENEKNSAYIIDLAEKHMNRISIKKTIDVTNNHLDRNNVDDALDSVLSHSQMKIGASYGIDVINDRAAHSQIFLRPDVDLIRFPGDLGKFYSGQLVRDAFVSFLGPEKRGKTFHLIDMAWRAMQQRRKVAFFGVGDMTENQMMKRFAARAVRRPLYPAVFDYPVKLKRKNNEIKIKYEKKIYTTHMQQSELEDAMDKARRLTRSNKTLLRMSTHSNGTLSVRAMGAILRHWEQEEWTPDIVVIDYADILAPPQGIKEVRDQINRNWMELRALSQDWHCLVVTATQADAQSYQARSLGMKNFSEDKRKLAHVTGMFGLNQSMEEKQQGLMRLNRIVTREGGHSANQQITVASCLAIANPTVLSVF